MPDDLRTRFEAALGFPLDPFQQRALDALDAGQSRARRRAHRLGQDDRGRVRDRRARSPRAPRPSTRRR